MENVDLDKDGLKETLRFKFQNRIGSGSASITLEIIVDGINYTNKASLQISDGIVRSIMPGMSVTSYYGDEVYLMVNHGGKIVPGKHQVKIRLTVDWESYETMIEDEVK
ncbi:hypothetical protein KEJ36_00970 [Candidatus Bathyarchaeota archaeon]|nr:hypothetical protein [Candidatus Bathyarchaeota archaeon]MBS7627396.1 hypothetical protein [Candidatus Bathyarchaeota archaeon]